MLIGVLMAASPAYGVGLLLAVCYVALVLVNLPLGLAIWVSVTLFERLPFVWVGPTAAALMVLLAWAGTLRTRRTYVAQVLGRHRLLLASLGCLLVWMSVTAMWAEDQVRVATETGKWFVAAIILVVVATTVARPSHLRLLLAAFVVGAVVSVGLGLVDLVIPYDFALEDEGDRLKGGGGDSNYLAAGLVSALVLAGGLAGAISAPPLRWGVCVAAVAVAGGIAATQSRGGLIALGVTAVAAIVVFRQRRPQVIAFTLVVAITGAAWFTASPTAWNRIVTTELEGTGRADLWTVGWRMFRDHPVAGVGMHNYSIRAGDYVREPGTLESVELIADRPHEPHNVFLGLLAETGIVGLLLYLMLVLACLAAMRRSIRAFEALGEHDLTDLSRAVLVATIGALTASVFIPNGGDKRLFVLMALGPAMLGIAAGWTQRQEIPRPRKAGDQGAGPGSFGPARSSRPAARVGESLR